MLILDAGAFLLSLLLSLSDKGIIRCSTASLVASEAKSGVCLPRASSSSLSLLNLARSSLFLTRRESLSSAPCFTCSAIYRSCSFISCDRLSRTSFSSESSFSSCKVSSLDIFSISSRRCSKVLINGAYFCSLTSSFMSWLIMRIKSTSMLCCKSSSSPSNSS